MKILGIDPGSRVSGYAIIEVNKLKMRYIASGVIKPELGDSFFERLPSIYDKFQSVIEKHQVQFVAIESLIHVKIVVSLSKLAQARGVMLASVAKSGAKIFEYSPNKVKSSVSGYGHADKEMIHLSIERILGEKINCATHDESDALAIAITHGIETMGRGVIKSSRTHGLFTRKSSSLAASINPDKLKQ
jgi:crossover junction endodeoxyribonuclease RuvC